MAKKMIDVNRHLFERLEQFLPTESETIASLKTGIDSIRYIGTKNGSYAQTILQNSDFFEKVTTFDKSLLYAISVDEKKYLVITGTAEISSSFLKGIETIQDPDNLEQDLKFNSGLVTSLFADNNFPIQIDDDKKFILVEKVFGREGREDGKFKPSDLTEYFSDFTIWEIGVNFENLNYNSLLSIYSGYLFVSGKNVNLNFSETSKQNIKLLIEELPMELIGGNIYRAVTAMEWKHAFLEMYQCIEYLFPIPYLKTLATSMKDSTLLHKLFVNTENDLGWRPKENEALSNLLRRIESKPSFIDILGSISAFVGSTPANADNNIAFVAKHIYNIRNSIAHFRSALDSGIKKDSEWAKFIEHLANIIYDLYMELATEISSIK